MSTPEAPATSDARWSLRKAITDPDGYLVLLILTVTQLALWLLVLDRNLWVHVVAYWLLLVTIIMAMHRGQVHRVAFRVIAAALLAIGAAWTVAVVVTGNIDTDASSTSVAISSVIYACLLALAFPLIVRRAFAHRVVSLDTMCALLTAYLFIGLFFASLFRAVGGFGEPFFNGDVVDTTANAVYFAFECLTTLGMGDLTPTQGLPRMLTILCALAGQLFLVTAVARTVSLFGQERQGKLVD